MSKIYDFKDYPIKDFLTWYENKGLLLSPKFQRNAVWNNQAKSYLIDTILKELPIPPIFMKEYIDRNTKKTIREVIDGQQRLTAIIEYYLGNFKIFSVHNKEFGNKYYEDLSDDAQIDFLGFNIPIVLVKTDNDALVYDMFARLNTNNVVLNKQELRNSKYWGDFKVFANSISTDYRSFFTSMKTFTDKQLSRMADIELVNSLITVLLDGIITESPKKIDTYYANFDSFFPSMEEVENKFSSIMGLIEETFDSTPFRTKFFHTKNGFYTLFSAINHLLYRLPNEEFDSVNTSIDSDNLPQYLKTKLEEFESTLTRVKDGHLLGEEYHSFKVFLDYHRTRTTSKNERVKRVYILLEHLVS